MKKGEAYEEKSGHLKLREMQERAVKHFLRGNDVFYVTLAENRFDISC